MKLNELNEKFFMHDEIIKDIKYDKKNNVLKMVLEFCEWQLEELNEKYKGLELTFNDVEQVLSYTDLNQLIKDNNCIEFLNIKKIRGQKKFLLCFGLNHWTIRNKNKNVDDWFFIEFLCSNYTYNYID